MNLPLFQPNLVNQRWTKAYYEELAETRFSCNNSTQLDQSHTTVTLPLRPWQVKVVWVLLRHAYASWKM